MENTTGVEHTTTDLHEWLIGRVADYVEVAAEEIDPSAPLGDYGLDSVLALAMAAEIEDRLGVSLDPTVLWDHPTIDDLTRFLTEP